MANTLSQNAHDLLQCGYIKAKFPLQDDKPLPEHMFYSWVNEIKRPRVTSFFCYISLGHNDLPDNKTAREYIGTIESVGGKITRLDFNIDYLGKLDFDAFYGLHDNDQNPTPSIVKSPTGATVYVGKRSSARLLRVYDKRGEILARKKCDIGFDITRIELEVKRGMVARYKALFLAGKTDIILSDIQTLYGLRGFCEQYPASKPVDTRDKSDSLYDFIHRYRRTIRRAYEKDLCHFLDIIGVRYDV